MSRAIHDSRKKITMADLQEIIGRVVRQERQGRNLTIKGLGTKAGLSEIYVGEIERGQKYPSAKVLESLAGALDLDISELLELVADEIRREREPQYVSAIGISLPRSGQPRRDVFRNIVNMLEDDDFSSVANFSAFLLAQHKVEELHANFGNGAGYSDFLRLAEEVKNDGESLPSLEEEVTNDSLPEEEAEKGDGTSQ